ncbi:MAG: MarR family transcriptional regulator [Gammaproteobacteria bacterium]|nr:MarR family transcriptional regulator [Gammaproteobacteria bacterium]
MKARIGTQDALALRIAVVIKRLRSRLREVASEGMPISQLTILHYLRTGGPATAASLAEKEHVTQQAIAQNLTVLKRAGLVDMSSDKADRRKKLVRLTVSGNKLYDSVIATRNAWLSRAINTTVHSKDLPALEKGIGLLEQIADSNG